MNRDLEPILKFSLNCAFDLAALAAALGAVFIIALALS